MKVSGFTFVRNATLLGYPFIESIQSALPICDEFVVAVGKGEDDTLERLKALNEPKIKIIETEWNEKLHERGFVYAQQKMIAWYNCTGDWAFYLEGDEILHEDELPKIRACMEKHLDNPKVEAMVFNYHHFYGTPNHVGISPGWYRTAPRIIRNTRRAIAGGGLYFLMMDKKKRGRYPYAVNTDAHIYHYGWVRSIEQMSKKSDQVSKFWAKKGKQFPGYGDTDPQAIGPFNGTHPAIIQPWLDEYANQELVFNPDYTISKKERRRRWMMKLEKLFNLELSKKFYKPVK